LLMVKPTTTWNIGIPNLCGKAIQVGIDAG
jgi:hypothetical protein